MKDDDYITITIDFDEAVQAIAYLSDLFDYLKARGVGEDVKRIRTAKEICEAFCCEHFYDELIDDVGGAVTRNE